MGSPFQLAPVPWPDRATVSGIQRCGAAPVRSDSGLEDQENSEIDLPDEADEIRKKEYILENRYYHEITAAEADSTSNVLIELPYELDPNDKIKVNGKRGYLQRGDHWKLQNPRTHIEIIVDHVDLEEGDIIELYIYKLQWSSTP